MTDTTTLPPPPPPRPPAAVAAPTPARPGVMARLLRPLVEARTWKATLQAVLDLPFGVAWFTIIVTGLSVGVGTLVTLIGIPILLLLLLFSRALSGVERGRAGLLLDIDVPSPFRSLPAPGGLWAWSRRSSPILPPGRRWPSGCCCSPSASCPSSLPSCCGRSA